MVPGTLRKQRRVIRSRCFEKCLFHSQRHDANLPSFLFWRLGELPPELVSCLFLCSSSGCPGWAILQHNALRHRWCLPHTCSWIRGEEGFYVLPRVVQDGPFCNIMHYVIVVVFPTPAAGSEGKRVFMFFLGLSKMGHFAT
ncbi:hypothetical protein AVEN_50878-1 [Araneus ventricosus]|uniref:Uncharacterized protein n=1 Tax=Araneus ventricosus TaxID=182803 RepID=A0A4Y2SVP0_ARAVE|nr:hypothetical protein AVEN_50878-1 [Araneus ventricosus]